MAEGLRKHWRLAVVVLGILTVFIVLYLLRAVLLPFAVGLALAYLLVPLVSLIERRLPPPGKWLTFKRVFSVLLVLVVLIGLLLLFFYFIATVVINASVVLMQNAPYYIGRSLQQVQLWFTDVRAQFPPEVQREVDQALIDGGLTLGRNIRDALLGGIAAAPRTFGTIFGFVALPFFLFYVLKDSEKLKRMLGSPLTPGVAQHVRDIVNIIEMVLGRYLRAQLMLGVIVGYFSFVGLLILNIQFAPVLAVLAGITELVPTLGPWIGGAAAVIVTLAVSPEKAIWVVVLYLAIQLVENYFLVPRVQSAYLHIHPAMMIVIIVLGAYIAGFWGLLLAAPLTATAIEITKYICLQYQVACKPDTG